MTELQKFKNYWDRWHAEWIEKADTFSEKSTIKGWPILKPKEKNIYHYFPEPYWGGQDEALKGIILNINPGEPKDYHHYKKSKNPLYFPGNGTKYSDIIESISNAYYNNENNEVETTLKWMTERVDWLKVLLDNYDLNLFNVLLPDLVPWHTKAKKEINFYFINKATHKLILQNVIRRLANISSTIDTELKCKIIVRGSNLIDFLNQLEKKIVNEYSIYAVINHNKDSSFKIHKASSWLYTINLYGVTFFVFTGGPNMSLPDTKSIVYLIKGRLSRHNRNGMTLKNFIINY